MDTSFHAYSLTLLGFIFNCYNPITFINSLAFGPEDCADVTRDMKPCWHRSVYSLITDKEVLAQDAAFYMQQL